MLSSSRAPQRTCMYVVTGSLCLYADAWPTHTCLSSPFGISYKQLQSMPLATSYTFSTSPHSATGTNRPFRHPPHAVRSARNGGPVSRAPHRHHGGMMDWPRPGEGGGRGGEGDVEEKRIGMMRQHGKLWSQVHTPGASD